MEIFPTITDARFEKLEKEEEEGGGGGGGGEVGGGGGGGGRVQKGMEEWEGKHY